MKQEPLIALRKQIDDIDRQIVGLLDARAEIARRVGAAKKNGPVYRPARERQVLQQVAAQGTGAMPTTSLQAVYTEIVSACRNLQQPLRVVYLGPEGTYCEEAAQLHCGKTSGYVPANSIDDAIRLVETGEADTVVVPIENSLEGPVQRTLDILQTTPLSICGELYLPIQHQLLSNAPDMQAIQEVIAHPQALAQCRQWLDIHLPHAAHIPAASNAAAAQHAARQPAAAAIAGARAARLYSLSSLAQSIQDIATNTTRFIVLHNGTTPATGSDKTSLICTTPNRPGALHGALAVFAKHGVNMLKLESRPAPHTPWHYLFYIDIDGHRDDATVAAAVAALQQQVVQVTINGSYPKGTL